MAPISFVAAVISRSAKKKKRKELVIGFLTQWV